MIVGVGSDLTDIRRIAATLERFGERFTTRVFTEIERRRSEAKPDRAASYAKRFAAKEACAKALGTGMRRGVFWRDMGVVNARSGRPTLALTGGAAERLAELLGEGGAGVIHVSLTDDHPYAQAFVIIEARPEGPLHSASPPAAASRTAPLAGPAPGAAFNSQIGRESRP